MARLLSVTILCALIGFAVPSGYAADDGWKAKAQNNWWNREIVGHLMRRLGFGPTELEMQYIMNVGPVEYLRGQFNPGSIDDSELEALLPPPGGSYEDFTSPSLRWYLRMVYSRRQLQEKMTLIWHEHFATSNRKVNNGCFMAEQEETLRTHALGKFPDMLTAMARDQALLKWLDNDNNDGKAYDDEGNLIPPNENFARELLQLFVLGTSQLALDGTPERDAEDNLIPAYSEQDVKELARALTGWRTTYQDCGESAFFDPGMHDNGDKVIFGETILGKSGMDGYFELDKAMDIIVAQPTMAPFISRMLIQKIATETPSAEYIERVATVFRDTGGDIRQVLIAIINDPLFLEAEVVTTQLKTPIEQYVGTLRAIEATTGGGALINWTGRSGHRVYYPPSVFSFYPPGNKGALLDTAKVILRDNIADEMVEGHMDTVWEPWYLIANYQLTTPEIAVDFLSDRLLSRPLQSEVRQEIIDYMEGVVTQQKFQGAFYLMLLTPEFQLN